MMPAFLINYDRRRGSVDYTRFDSLVEATRERLRLDRENFDPNREIVAVASMSEQHLRNSHSRYFSSR